MSHDIFQSAGKPLNLVIEWIVPDDIKPLIASYTKVRIYRSEQENTGYELIDEIDSTIGAAFVDSYQDLTALDSQRFAYYYLVTYYKPSLPTAETKWFITFFQFTPREQRLIDEVKTSVSPFIACKMTDKDFRAGLLLSLQLYNTYSPVTNFNFDNFPSNHEPLIVYGAQMTTLFIRYLGVAITDFSYTDQGITLSLDRGSKIKQAIDNVTAMYNQMMFFAKIEQAFDAAGVGTLQLPVSIGGNLSSGLLGILDIFNAVGR